MTTCHDEMVMPAKRLVQGNDGVKGPRGGVETANCQAWQLSNKQHASVDASVMTEWLRQHTWDDRNA